MIIDELKAIQHQRGYLPPEELEALSAREKIPLYELHAVASFYPHFRLKPPAPVEVHLCTDMSCHLCPAPLNVGQVEAALKAAAISGAEVKEVSCLGRCDGPPAIAINEMVYTRQTPEMVAQKAAAVLHGKPLRRERMPRAFTRFQIDPYTNTEEQYGALRRIVESGDFAGAIETLKGSDLRGMGGAGFPAGTKWEIVRNAPGDEKYVICNADESEPGTFKDRVLMQEASHLVLEGTILAGLAVGAKKGYIYLRHEYARERESLARALRYCQRQKLAGSNILGSGLSLHVEIFDSPGGYICGEETALLEALEGKRAEPRNKPPFPGTHGLWGKPTVINNVETFAMVPCILMRGADWWKAQGQNGAAGLKFLAISGHVRKPGVYEIPMGLPVSKLIYDYAGGISKRRKLKAFAPSGASSGFLPASTVDVPLDFKALAEAGSMLGSGAMVAVAEGTCMLDLAMNVTAFFRDESCGKCVPCRVGTEKMVNILRNISRGEASQKEFDLIAELSEAMQLTSICGLGQFAPYAIFSVLKYFRDEVYDHITTRQCPSGICFS